MNELQLNTDLLIKNFLKNVLQVPSKEDFEAVNQRLLRLEREVARRFPNKGDVLKSKKTKPGRKNNKIDRVLKSTTTDSAGTSIKTIKKTSGLEDKQVRNCIYQLEKLGRIKRVRRGFYRNVVTKTG